jgi:hypothetical protein
MDDQRKADLVHRAMLPTFNGYCPLCGELGPWLIIAALAEKVEDPWRDVWHSGIEPCPDGIFDGHVECVKCALTYLNGEYWWKGRRLTAKVIRERRDKRINEQIRR